MYLLISDYCRLYCYDGDQIIAEYNGSNALMRKFIYGPGIDEPICMIAVNGETETRYYYHFDGLGSVVALSDSSADIVERYRYDIFGEPNRTSSIGNPYMFTGRDYDSETGLYYYRARYYDYTTGRFLQADPIGYNDGMNLYQYCLNNPISWIDPWGLTTNETSMRPFPYIGYGPGYPMTPQELSRITPDFPGARHIAREEAKKWTGHNDYSDAMRHAEWNRRMVEELDPGWLTAFVAGLGHEVGDLKRGFPLNETLMDLHNNKVGRKAGLEGKKVCPDDLQTSPNNSQKSSIGSPKRCEK